MKSNLKRQSYIVIGVVLAAALGFLLLAFLPGMRSIARIRREIDEKQDFVAQTEKKRPWIAKELELRKTITDFTAVQRKRLVTSDAVSHLFSQISTLTKTAGTRTTRFQPHETVDYDTFHRVPVELGVTGKTEAVVELIRQIENLPHTIWINGLKLNTAGEAGELTRCDIEMEVFVDNREISD
jgi:Tfp pilus assembly protein PilO